MFYVGGFDITEIGWAGASSVYVVINHGGAYTGHLFQLYAGRTLIGVTADVWETRIVGPLPIGGPASPLSVLAVDPVDRLTNVGPYLCRKPYNDFKLSWPDPGDPDSDTHHFDIVAGRNPGETYDLTNVVMRVPYTAGRAIYDITIPPFADSGDWHLAVVPRDNAQPLGNAGDETPLTIPALVYPPALQPQPNGRSFIPTLAAGSLSIDYTYGTIPAYPS